MTEEPHNAPAAAGGASHGTVSAEHARSLALRLPEAIEQDHHGRPSFRVAGKIFATLWDEHHMNVMLDEAGIRTAVQADPETCAEVWWGRRLSAVSVSLPRVRESILAELLADAWERRAPARLTENSDSVASPASKPSMMTESSPIDPPTKPS